MRMNVLTCQAISGVLVGLTFALPAPEYGRVYV